MKEIRVFNIKNNIDKKTEFIIKERVNKKQKKIKRLID
jgi:hypothetical protein